MRNPQSNAWSPSPDKEAALVSPSGSGKTFKRKSREPKRLLSRPEHASLSDDDSAAGARMEACCGVGGLTPAQRRPAASREVAASPAGMGMAMGMGPAPAPAPSGAIDMRIGVSVPAITSKLSKLPAPPLADAEISHWPIAISQPLSNRLKLGLCPSLPLSLPTSRGHSLSPTHQFFPLESGLPGPAAPPPGPRTSHTLMCQEHEEPQVQSPKESPRKRAGVGVDGSGCLPEVKALQQNRRLLANARERTRVHTISAAFEALRKQVPCYSYGQKLSKLAILRIACNYILSLAQLAELDYSPDHGSVSFSQCVEQCTRTLQAEGRSKKRKVGRTPEDL